jgi:hypothetical protein
MLDAASVGLAAYASDELGRKHHYWTVSVRRTGASIDRRQTRLSLLFMTVGFQMSWTRGVARSDRRTYSVCHLGDRCYYAASIAPEICPVKGITTSGFSIRYK